jgi:energy-coupling factor transport system ATP-binding protein
VALLEAVDLVHVYMEGTPFEVKALDGVTLRIEEGEAVGLAGPTGSGKSTLVQHFNGLLRPTSGQVRVGGVEIPRRGDLRPVRALVGMLFQFPEQQLFEETVAQDVAFGPRNLGLRGEELTARVNESLRQVGLDPAEFGPRSPFTLSGGQQRLVALAGVLATGPRCLILDEPTAGLDPRSRTQLLESLGRWRRELGLTLVVISHHMEELARLVDRLVVMDSGRVVADAPLRELFSRPEWMARHHLDVPSASRTAQLLATRGLHLDPLPLTLDEAEEALARVFHLD